MDKEDIVMLAQMLHTLRELVGKLEEAFKKNDAEMLRKTKFEILKLQKRIRETI